MGCFHALLARIAFFVVWVSTSMVSRAFHGGWILPLLGILFLPFTALSYVVVYALGNGVTGWAWLWVVLGFIFDLTAHGSGARANRRRFGGSNRSAGRGPSVQAQ
jgi:hypothetical protein